MEKIVDMKSSPKLIKYFIETVEEHILDENQVLPASPTSFVNLLFDQMGALTSSSFYEMLMIKQEAVKATAKLRRSLVRNLDNVEFQGVMGSPANFIFRLGFSVNDLIKFGTVISPTQKRLVINRDVVFNLTGDKPPFTMDRDIAIQITYNGDLNDVENATSENYSVFAKFIVDGSTSVTDVSNPFIKAITTIVDGVKYFLMTINTAQYEREYIEYNNINAATREYEYDIPYSESLYHFEILYKASDDDEYTLLEGQPDGLQSSGYNFSLKDTSVVRKSLSIKFSRDPKRFSPAIGSSIKIVKFETYGDKGNFQLHDIENTEPEISLAFRQDRDDPEQDGILNTIPILTISSPSAKGGSREMTIDELRSYVINKSDSEVLTTHEFRSTANALGLTVKKERFDLLNLYFRLFDILEHNGIILSTTTGVCRFDLDELISMDSVDALLLPPSTNIAYGDKVYGLTTEDPSLEDYTTAYSEGNSTFFFPYFIQMAVGDYIQAKVTNMYKDEYLDTIFNYYDQFSASGSDIGVCVLSRDPMAETVNDDGKYVGKYNVKFNIFVNTFIVSNYTAHLDSIDEETGIASEPSPIKINMVLSGANGSFVVNDDNVTISIFDNKTLLVDVELTTDCGIDSYGRISMNDFCLEPFPRSSNVPVNSYYVEESDLDINISFFGRTDKHSATKYDKMIKTEDRVDYYTSTVYSIESVKWFEDLTHRVEPIIDLQMGDIDYLRYNADIPKFHEVTTMVTDEFGEPIYTDTILKDADNVDKIISVPEILNRAGDVMLDEDGEIIYEYKIGDLYLDVLGTRTTGSMTVEDNVVTVIRTDPKPSYNISIVNTPLIDRIHKYDYTNVIGAIQSIIDRSDTLVSPGSGNRIGVSNVVGSGEYYFKDRSTSEIVRLDRLALSLNIGVALNNVASTTDTKYIIAQITDEIVKYIRNNSTSEVISFVEVLDHVKGVVQTVKYFEMYNVNEYANGVCQSIFKGDTAGDDNEDIITVRNGVDVVNSDLANDVIVLKPDIKISII